MTVVELLALAGCLFWVAVTLDRSRAWPREMRLPVAPGADAGRRPPVVALIPARNEAAQLPRTLPPLLAQEELAAVVLVDDGSEDGTSRVARELAAAAGRAHRLRVVAASPTPPGWAGKVWALACGLEAVATDPGLSASPWLLLTDADIEHRPGSVRSLLEQAGADYDLVSVMARLRTESLWERLLAPTFVFFFQLLYPFRKVADARSGIAAAAGGCVLVRRPALERAGGMASIAGAIIDDVALARSVAAAGGRLWLGLDPGIRSLRSYPRLADLWQMVARSAFDQLGYRFGLLMLVLLGLGLFCVAPPLLLALGAVGALAGEPSAWRAALWAAAAWALELRALRPAVQHHGLSWPYALVLPVSSLLFGAMTAASAWAHLSGRGTLWRGRRIDPVRE